MSRRDLDSGSLGQLSCPQRQVFDFSKDSEERAMYAVEFQAKIKNGTIEIPEVYRKRFKERVRVILLAEEESTIVNLIDQLLQHPLKVAEFKPLSREEIYERT
jgi:hypothetical protein